MHVWRCRAGLSVPVRRGSALDVGSYHSQLPRCRLSLEMWVRRPDDTDRYDAPSH